jgi:tripartite-type tricarboxylate transporter receptor subunit TctC
MEKSLPLRVLVCLCAVAFFAMAVHVQAQNYPFKTIRLIVPYTPGGGTDVLSRVLAQKLTEAWGQPVVVDNRPGAGGILGTELAARAPADGYTLLTIPSSHTISPSLYSKLPYDPIKDFTAVGLIATSPNILVVHPSLPARSVPDLIALAKQHPGQLAYASAGVGSTTHLAGVYFQKLAKINTVHVPYKGSGQAEIDLATGQVQYMIDSVPAALPNIRAGRTSALATTGKRRFVMLPGVPTVAEAALPNYESVSWWGILAPTGTPRSIVEKLNKEVTRIMNLSDVKELVLAQGADSWTSTPQYFLDHMKQESALYARIIKEAGIKIE